MKNNKYTIQNINDVAEYSVDRAVKMVDMLNSIAGTMYCIINKRVSYFTDDDGNIVEPYKNGCFYNDAELAF